ncbi:unnamed protein product [Adineta steineri]|uniref:DUF1275 domain-containing protein n=1 Tax=Adineta steineri TaxID=433720 RepID=A0A813M4P4_9BILA|nr:unnamed protein product [Adineta steineri]CAF3707312.1 unnamed protein product [Adineta steineri]
MQNHRRSTIINPSRYIHEWHWHAFSALVLVGCLLAFVAGYVNTICIVSAFRLPLTALTGSTAKMAIVLAQGHFDVAFHFILLIFSFAMGSFISAALIGGSSFRIQRHYGLVLILESIALGIGCLFQDVHVSLHAEWEALTPSAYLICLGFGLQNGMCTTFSGAVIRTTHVTGTLTDIGLIIGQAIFHKRTRKHLWKLKILVPLYLSFCCGAVVGWFAFELLHNKAILIPCTIVGCLGLGHTAYCKIFLNLNLRKIQARNEEIFKSTRLSIVIPETIPELSIASDKHSSDMDPNDSEVEHTAIEHCLSTQNSTTPLLVAVYHPEVIQEQ